MTWSLVCGIQGFVEVLDVRVQMYGVHPVGRLAGMLSRLVRASSPGLRPCGPARWPSMRSCARACPYVCVLEPRVRTPVMEPRHRSQSQRLERRGAAAARRGACRLRRRGLLTAPGAGGRCSRSRWCGPARRTSRPGAPRRCRSPSMSPAAGRAVRRWPRSARRGGALSHRLRQREPGGHAGSGRERARGGPVFRLRRAGRLRAAGQAARPAGAAHAQVVLLRSRASVGAPAVDAMEAQVLQTLARC